MGKVGDFSQTAIHDAIKSASFTTEALQTVALIFDLFESEKMVYLPRHRTKAAHLEHEPFIGLDAQPRVLWQKSLGLLGEIKKDGSRLEHVDRLAGRTVKIGYGRDFIVGANGQKAGFELLVLGDVNHLDPVVEFHFL